MDPLLTPTTAPRHSPFHFSAFDTPSKSRSTVPTDPDVFSRAFEQYNAQHVTVLEPPDVIFHPYQEHNNDGRYEVDQGDGADRYATPPATNKASVTQTRDHSTDPEHDFELPALPDCVNCSMLAEGDLLGDSFVPPELSIPDTDPTAIHGKPHTSKKRKRTRKTLNQAAKDSKHKDFLERNRIAANHCRKRKKDNDESLQAECRDLERRNTMLRGTRTDLMIELHDLKEELHDMITDTDAGMEGHTQDGDREVLDAPGEEDPDTNGQVGSQWLSTSAWFDEILIVVGVGSLIRYLDNGLKPNFSGLADGNTLITPEVPQHKRLRPYTDNINTMPSPQHNHHESNAMSSTSNQTSEIELRLLLPKVMNPIQKVVVDLRNPGLVLTTNTLFPKTVIWDLLLGIPFSLLVAFFNKAFICWLGYEKIMRCPSGILASRLITVVVNLWVVWSWRRQLVQEQQEERIKTEIHLLDEVIACLERVLAGVERKMSSEPIFCCASVAPVNPQNNTKPHNDPNREVHNAIFNSFINFAYRRQAAVTLMALIQGYNPGTSTSPTLSPSSVNSTPQEIPKPLLTPEELQNNPITPNTPYVIHLTSRLDFGPVLSHRYFVCPSSLQLDWIEVSLGQWWAAGEQFKLKVEKLDVKCLVDSKFYRLTLRPNLSMRFPPAEEQLG
ncbi:ATF CREB activator 1 [Hyphodiscus hymeniophilus]|uniref:ATF CREB activator 1 n=1 Tax=Hyphodiscus hymeniophilus TaxID=353542 RepID=A0A9P6VJ96_9HELO|nr:ATF CREB activator 1 [Hyphodiscus hymeniophilus]